MHVKQLMAQQWCWGTTGFTQSGLETSVDSISGVTLKHGTNTTVPVTQFAGTYTDEIIASAATGSGLRQLQHHIHAEYLNGE